MNLFYFLSLLSAASFLCYAISCLVTPAMLAEFERYGMARYRMFVGISQLLAVAGLLLGLWIPWLGALAAGGLAFQMLLALIVRFRIQDGMLRAIPAFVYLVLNASLVVLFLRATRHV